MSFYRNIEDDTGIFRSFAFGNVCKVVDFLILLLVTEQNNKAVWECRFAPLGACSEKPVWVGLYQELQMPMKPHRVIRR